MDVLNATAGAGQTTAATERAEGPPNAQQREQIVDLARQFEGMLMAQMLRSMRGAMLDDQEGNGLGSDTMSEVIDTELGLALAQSGGFGLADVLIRALGGSPADMTELKGSLQDLSPAAAMEVASRVGSAYGLAAPPRGLPGAPAPLGPDRPAEPAGRLPGPVSSSFGWRTDPINGQVKFHKGVDIRLAYGQDVRTPSEGTVVFAGEQGSYGLSVVLDHGQGVQTRYAHLSSYSVREGDQVRGGQVVGLVGTSGRSTGPHLHFEVTKNGQAVDPRTAFKPADLFADSTSEQTVQGEESSL